MKSFVLLVFCVIGGWAIFFPGIAVAVEEPVSLSCVKCCYSQDVVCCCTIKPRDGADQDSEPVTPMVVIDSYVDEATFASLDWKESIPDVSQFEIIVARY